MAHMALCKYSIKINLKSWEANMLTRICWEEIFLELRNIVENCRSVIEEVLAERMEEIKIHKVFVFQYIK